MAFFILTKADPSDRRDIGLEVEQANDTAAHAYDGCVVQVIGYSGDDSRTDWVLVEFLSHSPGDCDEASDWYSAELSRRGIVLKRTRDFVAHPIETTRPRDDRVGALKIVSIAQPLCD